MLWTTDSDKLNNLLATGKRFLSTMVQTRISWSRLHTTRKLAHYEPARDRIVVSLTLDDPQVPQFVFELVMYHELLHKQHGHRWVNGRLMVHTSEFRQDERQFELYEATQKWLGQLRD